VRCASSLNGHAGLDATAGWLSVVVSLGINVLTGCWFLLDRIECAFCWGRAGEREKKEDN
jgi:hypothetical protein